MAIGEGGANLLEAGEHLIDVAFGVRHQVGRVERAGFGGPHLLDDELEVVLVVFDAAADAEHSAIGHGGEHLAGCVPDAHGHLTGAIGAEGLDVEFAGSGGGQLLVGDDKNVLDNIARRAILEKQSPHDWGLYPVMRWKANAD